MAGWDNVRLKRLKTLAGKGLSSTEIGKCLGMSKNAIIGKLNRMGWNLKATTGHTKTVATKADDKPAKKTKLPVSKKIAPVKPVVMPKATKVAKAGARKKSDADKKTKTTKSEKKQLPRATRSKKKESTVLAMHQRIIQHSLELASLKTNQCRWPIGDPDSENFHFCGKTVFVGKPYCYEHCRQAYQFTTPPKKK